MKNVLVCCLFAVLLSAGVRAETLEHPQAGLKLDVPAGWEHHVDGDLLIASNPNDDVVLIIYAATDGTAKDFITHIATEMEHLIKNPKVTKGPKTEKVNTLTQDYLEGTGALLEGDKWIPKGEKAGESVDWDLTLVTGAKAPLVVVAFGKLADNQKVIDAVYRSIKK